LLFINVLGWLLILPT